MSGRYLLDSNAVISLFANDQNVVSLIASASECHLPVIVLGELLYGARKSNRVSENIQRILDFQQSINLLVCDDQTANSYSDVKNLLRLQGRPIPENDIWIAALARQYQYTLVSRDGHFQEVEQLTMEVW